MRYKVRLAWAIALLLVIQLALRSAAPVLAVRSVPAVAAPPALGLSNLAVTTYDDPSPPFSLPPYSAVAIPETTLQAASISIESSPPLVQDGDDPVPVTLQGNGASDGSGIHQYFVPFDDRELWELFEGKARCHGEQFQACLPLVSRIFVTAGANGTLWYYDHWEDGYDAEPLNPGPGSTTVTGTLDAGGTERFESNILVTQIGRAPYYYDGRDRITIEGEDANVVRWANAGSFQRSAGAACNPGGGGGDPDSSGWLAAAWEVLEVGDWGDVYHATVGEDLDYSSGVPDDHDYAGLEVMAAQDGTEVYYEGIRVATLDAGGTYFVPGSNPTDGPGGDGVDSSDDISATMPIQVQMMTGACSGNIVSAHGYTLQPRDVWDTVYWAPVPGFLQTGDPGERPNVDTDIYLHNPDRARAISVTVTSGLSVASLSIPPDSTVSVLRESGWPDLDEAQGTHMSSADVFWGVAVIDSATNGTGDSQDWDWGYSLVPDSELSSQIVVGYAPGKPDLGDNGSLAFIVAAADTRIYVDLDHNGQPDRFDINGDGDANDNDAWGWDEGVSDQGVLVQAGQVLRVGDPVDRNLEGARIYTTELGEHIAAAWGQDPARADTLGYLDLGYTLLPLQVPHLLKKADLAVDADGSGGLSPGDTLTYTLVLDNNGMGTMNRVVLTDSLPYTYTDFVVGSLQVTTPPPTDTVEYYDGGSWGATPISTAQELRITWPYLEPTQTVTITFRALLSTTIPADVTYICNEGVASSANTDPVTATICTPLQRLTDLEIVKADDPDPVLTGGVLTYTLDYANLAGVDAQEVYITDTLPNEVTYGAMVEQPAGWSGPEYAAVPTATLTWYTPTLAAGASGRMVYTVTVGAGFTGTITNTVCISTTIRDGRDDNNCDLEPTLVTDIPPCDVEILKSDDPDPVGLGSPGRQLIYTLVYANNGPAPAENVVVSDTLPPEVAFGAASPAPSSGPNPLLWNLRRLGVGEGGTIVVTATVHSWVGETFTNTANISTDTPEIRYDNNSDQEPTDVETDLAIEKLDESDPGDVGGPLTYTLVYTNNGPFDAQEVYITDTLPNEVTYRGMVEQPAGWSGPEYAAVPTATLTWYTPTLAAGASGRMVYTVTVDAGSTGAITNTVCISTTTPEGRDDNNCDVTPKRCDVEILKSDDPDPVGPRSPDRQLIYTLEYVNNGPAPAENVVVSDTLPPEVAFGAASPAPSSGPNPLLWNLGTLAVGEGGTIAVTVTVHSWVGETFTNTACIATDTPEVSSDNCAQELTSILTDVAIGKSDYRDPGTPGGTLTYTLVYTNNGPFDAQEVYITDTLPGPDEVTFGGVLEQPPGWIGPHKTVGPPTKLIWYTPTLPAGPVGRVVTGTIVYTVTADPNVPGHITNTVRIDTTTPEYNYDNNQAAEPTSVRLLYFRARSQPGAVALEWETAWEVDTYGFSLLRSAGGRLAEAREIAFVPAAGRGGSGAAYSYRDRRLEIGPTYSYWLAELDTSGRRTVYYPVTAAALPGGLYRAYLPLVWRQ